MATDRMALVDLCRKGQEPEADFLQEGVRWLVQELIDADVSAQIGAERYARTEERTTQRNGYRTRPGDTARGHAGGHAGTGHPQAAHGQLRPLLAGGAQARGAGAR